MSDEMVGPNQWFAEKPWRSLVCGGRRSLAPRWGVDPLVGGVLPASSQVTVVPRLASAGWQRVTRLRPLPLGVLVGRAGVANQAHHVSLRYVVGVLVVGAGFFILHLSLTDEYFRRHFGEPDASRMQPLWRSGWVGVLYCRDAGFPVIHC